MVRIRNNNVTMTHEFKISITTIYFSHHLVLFTVKTNGPPLFLGAKLKFHWLTLVPLWFYGHKIFTVFAGLAICRLRIAALCLPASIFGYLLWLEHKSKTLVNDTLQAHSWGSSPPYISWAHFLIIGLTWELSVEVPLVGPSAGGPWTTGEETFSQKVE